MQNIKISAEIYTSSEIKPLVCKWDIIQSAIMLQEIPIYPTFHNQTYKLFFTPQYGYYAFMLKPIIALSVILVFIYFTLNKVIQRGLTRLTRFEDFLLYYFKNGAIDENLYASLGEYDDEIYLLCVQTKKIMDENLRTLGSEKTFLRTLEELNEVVLELSQDFKIIEHNKSWIPIKKKSDNFLDYLNNKNGKIFLLKIPYLKNNVFKHIVFIDNLNTKERYFEIKIIDMENVFGVIIRDITDAYNTEQDNRRISLLDPLTNIPNRALFLEKLESEIKKAQRNNNSFAVLFFDLNKFKNINDDYGHEAGDKILVEFSQRVSSVLRASDTLARLGGDEFVAILGALKDAEELDIVIHKIDYILEKEVEYGAISLKIETSIGVSIYPEDGNSGDILILKADNAMYKSKKNNQKYCKYRHET
jgi:diguanylate cyclase (GGDEF)-like protein